MGGGGSFSQAKSRSSSKPVYTPQQIKIFEWMQQNIVPLAEGKETYLTQLMAQRARDEAAKLQQQSEMGLQNIAGATGMSAGQIGQSLTNQQNSALQQTLSQIMSNRQAMQLSALNMIGNIPMAPSEQSKSKSSEFKISGYAGMTGGGGGGG